MELFRRLGQRIHPGDLTGAFGDIGTFLPLWLAMVMICGLDPAASLILAGAANIATGLLFRIPMAVQPMKAIAAVAIAYELSAGSIAAAGMAMGFLMLLLGATRIAGLLPRLIPAPVVRGVQWAVALHLALAGVRLITRETGMAGPWGSIYPALVLLTVPAVLYALYRKRGGLVCALLLGVGGGVALGTWGVDGWSQIGASSWSLVLPAREQWTQGLLYGVVPQIPMTLLNYVVAV